MLWPFSIKGVKGVLYRLNFVTVMKDREGQPWVVIKPEVYSILMEPFSAAAAAASSSSESLPLFCSEEDRASVGSAWEDTWILKMDLDMVTMIKELLDMRIRPTIMEDGGDIEFRGFMDDGIMQIKLKGSCCGCYLSTVTLKLGIEHMLMHYIPKVKGMEQVHVQSHTLHMLMLLANVMACTESCIVTDQWVIGHKCDCFGHFIWVQPTSDSMGHTLASVSSFTLCSFCIRFGT